MWFFHFCWCFCVCLNCRWRVAPICLQKIGEKTTFQTFAVTWKEMACFKFLKLATWGSTEIWSSLIQFWFDEILDRKSFFFVKETANSSWSILQSRNSAYNGRQLIGTSAKVEFIHLIHAHAYRDCARHIMKKSVTERVKKRGIRWLDYAGIITSKFVLKNIRNVIDNIWKIKN